MRDYPPVKFSAIFPKRKNGDVGMTLEIFQILARKGVGEMLKMELVKSAGSIEL